MLFITEYAIIGSPCTGTYVVNANTKKEANQIVKAIAHDYTRIRSHAQQHCEQQLGVSFDEMVDGVTLPELGKAVQLECGT